MLLGLKLVSHVFCRDSESCFKMISCNELLCLFRVVALPCIMAALGDYQVWHLDQAIGKLG